MNMNWLPTHLVFRQVNPKHWDGKTPYSQAFFPTPKDDDQLSVDDSNLITAEGSWRHFTQDLGLQSDGTWAVSVEEISAAGDLALQPDPILDAQDPAKNNPAHCRIDFSKLTSKGQKKRCAQELALRASARGCQFRPSL
jgi:hypothetical protein